MWISLMTYLVTVFKNAILLATVIIQLASWLDGIEIEEINIVTILFMFGYVVVKM
jgi:hypothetical protein